MRSPFPETAARASDLEAEIVASLAAGDDPDDVINRLAEATRGRRPVLEELHRRLVLAMHSPGDPDHTAELNAVLRALDLVARDPDPTWTRVQETIDDAGSTSSPTPITWNDAAAKRPYG